jgi:hypothetical protein
MAFALRTRGRIRGNGVLRPMEWYVQLREAPDDEDERDDQDDAGEQDDGDGYSE